MNASEISAVLAKYRYRFCCEQELQDGIALALSRSDISFEREYRLTDNDRLDFFCEGIAVEVKIDGSAAAVLRQVHRYANHKDVNEILLVTTKASHSIPASLNGKKIVLHSLLGSAF